MSDMTTVTAPKSDQINADDLIGRNMTITIREVQIKGGQEQPVAIVFDGSDKVFRPCKSMSRVLVAAWGADAKKYVGRSLTLYRDPSVKWGGMEVGGIRISHMSDIERSMTMALTATKGSRKPFVVQPLANTPAPKPQPEQMDTDALLASVEAAADKGADALAAHWKALPQAHRDALKPYGADLRKRADSASTAPETQPQTLPAARPSMWTADGTTQYQTESEYLAAYEATVTRMYGSGDASALLKFDTQNKPHVEASGLSGAIGAINERVRRPGGLDV